MLVKLRWLLKLKKSDNGTTVLWSVDQSGAL